MNRPLIILIIIALALFWKFVLNPSKLEFADRVKTLQALTYTAEYKEAVAEYWKNNGTFPTAEEWNNTSNEIIIDFQKSLVESIKVGVDGPGVVSVFYTNARDNSIPPIINGKKIILTPISQGEQLDWSCKGNLPLEFLPKPCR